MSNTLKEGTVQSRGVKRAINASDPGRKKLKTCNADTVVDEKRTKYSSVDSLGLQENGDNSDGNYLFFIEIICFC